MQFSACGIVVVRLEESGRVRRVLEGWPRREVRKDSEERNHDACTYMTREFRNEF